MALHCEILDWNRRGVLQIVYLDSSSKVKLQNLVSFITTLHLTSTNRNTLIILYNKRLQILAYHDEQIPSVMKSFNVEESEQFSRILEVSSEFPSTVYGLITDTSFYEIHLSFLLRPLQISELFLIMVKRTNTLLSLLIT